jgi:hypothetical protein
MTVPRPKPGSMPYWFAERLEAQTAALRAERDEAVAALREIERLDTGEHSWEGAAFAEAADIARDVLARIEGTES